MHQWTSPLLTSDGKKIIDEATKDGWAMVTNLRSFYSGARMINIEQPQLSSFIQYITTTTGPCLFWWPVTSVLPECLMLLFVKCCLDVMGSYSDFNFAILNFNPYLDETCDEVWNRAILATFKLFIGLLVNRYPLVMDFELINWVAISRTHFFLLFVRRITWLIFHTFTDASIVKVLQQHGYRLS